MRILTYILAFACSTFAANFANASNPTLTLLGHKEYVDGSEVTNPRVYTLLSVDIGVDFKFKVENNDTQQRTFRWYVQFKDKDDQQVVHTTGYNEFTVSSMSETTIDTGEQTYTLPTGSARSETGYHISVVVEYYVVTSWVHVGTKSSDDINFSEDCSAAPPGCNFVLMTCNPTSSCIPSTWEYYIDGGRDFASPYLFDDLNSDIELKFELYLDNTTCGNNTKWRWKIFWEDADANGVATSGDWVTITVNSYDDTTHWPKLKYDLPTVFADRSEFYTCRLEVQIKQGSTWTTVHNVAGQFDNDDYEDHHP